MIDVTTFIAGCLAGSIGTFATLIFGFTLYSHLGKNFHQRSLLKSFFKKQNEGEKAIDDIFTEPDIPEATPPLRRPIIADDERESARESAGR